jgi:hypothetical protein
LSALLEEQATDAVRARTARIAAIAVRLATA